MILDKNLALSEAQAVTSTANSTNTVDQGAAGDAYGDSGLYLYIKTDVAATAVGAATVTFSLDTSADNSSFSTIYASAAVAKTALTAGSEPVKVKLPAGCLRYLRVAYTVATGPLTAGSFSAYLVKDVKIGSQ